MIWIAIILFLIGLGLSAFFSGSETGFYRASRVRLVMDAIEGDRTSQRLLYFSNHPPLFVATTLVGNNAANYLTSLAIVLGAKALFETGAAVEMSASICLSPVIFVYGELMPKSLYFQAPNRLLLKGGSLFFIFAILFAPISAVLWGLGRLLERLLGQSPEKIRLALAKKELGEVLIEGQHAGILHSTQLYLAHNFFLTATKTVRDSATPLSKLVTVSRESDVASALAVAEKSRLTEIAVYDPAAGDLSGYLRTVELMVQPNTKSIVHTINPLIEVLVDDLIGSAIMRLQGAREQMARVVDNQGKTFGVISLDALVAPLLSGPSLSLKR